MKCTGCGFEIQNDKALFCPKCGSKTSVENSNSSGESKTEAFPDLSNIWPGWYIEKFLGKGSYGTVYQAVKTDSGVETRAAVKIIHIPSDDSEVKALHADGFDSNGTKEYFKDMVNDFVEEIRLMDAFKGVQNIVSFEDYKVVENENEISWDVYIRMELLIPFGAYISDKKLTEKEVIKLGTDIATALEICSKKNVIHRDIKPENIFVNDFGYFKLGDFGIARKLENKASVLSRKGTLNYMAPEIVRSDKYDARVDLYSLSLMLYKLMNNNRLPFVPVDKQIVSYADRSQAVERRLNGEKIPAPQKASPAFAHIILKGCAFGSEDRFADAAEMKRALEELAQGNYKGHLLQESELDKTVFVNPGRGIQQNYTENERDSGGQDRGNLSSYPRSDKEKPAFEPQPVNTAGPTGEPKNKSYVSIVAIAVALGLLTGILVGGIILLSKHFSGALTLHADALQNVFAPVIKKLTDYSLFLL